MQQACCKLEANLEYLKRPCLEEEEEEKKKHKKEKGNGLTHTQAKLPPPGHLGTASGWLSSLFFLLVFSGFLGSSWLNQGS